MALPIVVNGVSATYDALGRMVEAGSGSTYVQVVFRPSGDKLAIVQNGVLSKGTVPLPGGASAIYNASGLSYIRHKDWLGSSRLATTWNHAVYAKEAYAPFGETYNEAGTAGRSFTGQDQDTTQGIYDFLYRRYDQSAGRWMSPDPSGWNAVNLMAPQSLNRYSYALNNPLRLVDPTGLSTRGDSCNGTVYSAVCSSQDAGCEETYSGCVVNVSADDGAPIGLGISEGSSGLSPIADDSNAPVASGGAPNNGKCLPNVNNFITAHLTDAQTLANSLGNGVTPSEVLAVAGNETGYGGGFAQYGNYFGLHGSGPAGTYHTTGTPSVPVAMFPVSNGSLLSGQVFVGRVSPFMTPGLPRQILRSSPTITFGPRPVVIMGHPMFGALVRR